MSMKLFAGGNAFLLLVTGAMLISSCSWVGDTRSVNEATDLAVACKFNEALATLNGAENAGGLSAYVAALERVAILREAGRTDEASEAMKAFLALPEASSTSADEIEESIHEFIEKLQNKRLQQTGSSTCR